jgi:transposase
MFGQNPTTVQRWIKSFEKNGFSGLEDGGKTGRPQRLDPKQLKEINNALRKSPHEFGYEQNLWDGKLLAHHIQKTHKVALGVRQCQRLFHKLYFRRRKPRPLIAHADIEEQSAFKKTPSVGSKKRY